ncbi:MAG: twin-arginine translocase subunit TatC [Micromonosporaceae bacterium]
MSLMDHLRELRSRLFKAAIGVVAGLVISLFFATEILEFLNAPYCEYKATHGAAISKCGFNAVSPVDIFLLNLRVALYAGLIISAPIWLYQVWAFVAPGLHRNERKYTYYFVGAATPLFLTGAFLAYWVVDKGLSFLMGLAKAWDITLDLAGYFSFVTSMMMLFGLGFLFPLVVVALNLLGLVSAKWLLGKWRIAVFICFAFAAVVTPTPDPFGMTALALPMSGLYFIAVGIAALNDRRKAKQSIYAGLDDDEASSLDDEAISAVAPVSPAAPIEGPADDGPAPGPSGKSTDDIT